MESWVWWLIWSFLVLLALGTWIIIIAGMKKPAQRMLESLERLAELGKGLEHAGASKAKLEHPKDNLRDDPSTQVQRRRALLEERSKRKQARARRLVARVKNIKVEGRFKDVR